MTGAPMPYLPQIRGGRPLMARKLGEYRLLLLGDLESPGTVQYLYVLAAFRGEEQVPCLCVASEKNMLHGKGLPGSGSHFLGVFPGRGHLNLGASDDWADLRKFAGRALEVCREHLGLPPG